jgi:hypothetical protein
MPQSSAVRRDVCGIGGQRVYSGVRISVQEMFIVWQVAELAGELEVYP